ncbi:hypothetical protein DFO66_107158 [Brevibacterium sanguinis]|uniref:Uncharacterized protein n=2 Tax=Brevibacterium TaxID=1696 RepID=A0A366IKZ8_9MICO|nr:MULTISPECIES: hypothetical protein [Brevibacterium]RBP64280.1 hypothetical protein DFO66_107158 [Brevibacterium sanguinis]RBP71428.1 hypothetical protein DFO65_10526 [Brevibacterium celere]
MAEEHFTSRRARREAERLAAEQAFEARSTPDQPNDSGVSRGELLTPAEPPAAPPETPVPAGDDSGEPAGRETTPETDGSQSAEDWADPTSRIDPSPAEHTVHPRGPLASDHPQETRPPVSAEDRLDPRRAPLPHFETRAERKRYLREHGLSMQGDLSTGAIPVIAGPEEHSAESAPEETGQGGEGTTPESFDTAGFGGASDEVAARDFEAPVTPDSAPRPSPVESRPAAAGDAGSTPEKPAVPAASEAPAAADSPAAAETAPAETAAPHAAAPDAAAPDAAAAADSGPAPRPRRMPIVAPPTTAGVRVVTAASAKVPDPEATGRSTAAAGGPRTSGTGTAPGTATGAAAAPESGADDSSGTTADALSGDEAARAMAANPETRPMDAVPEAWALPNPDYEDEETENPPGTRVRAAAVTGNDGRILVGEEPSKVPYIVLGVAALVAIGLIVVALVMLL